MMYDEARLLLSSGAIAETLAHTPAAESPPLQLLGRMRENHAAQWDAEDDCRRPGTTAGQLGRLKQRIDGLNRVRTDLIDDLDGWVGGHVTQAAGATPHTETYGASLDRIVIAALRAERLAVACAGSARAAAATSQYAELLLSYDALIDDVRHGRRRFPDWRSLKFYAAEQVAQPAHAG
jgi:hypothetical protein